MRTLNSGHKLQADSDPVVRKAFIHAVTDMEGVLYFQGRKLRPGPLLNGLAVWWAQLPESDRQRVGKEALQKLEGILADEPIAIAGRDESEADEQRRKAPSPVKVKGQREGPEPKGKPGR